MFEKVQKQLSVVTEGKEFLNILRESNEEELGNGESGLLPDEEELLVDPDSISEEELNKVMAAVDGMVDDEDLENVLLDAFGDDDGTADDNDDSE